MLKQTFQIMGSLNVGWRPADWLDGAWKKLVATLSLAGCVLVSAAADNPGAPASSPWVSDGKSAAPASQGSSPSASFKKPGWLTELSLGVKEGYDNNVYLSGVDAKFVPPTFTPPAGSAAAMKDRSSWVTTVSPKAEVNLAPLLQEQGLQSLSVAYALELAVYHDQPEESYEAHRFATLAQGKWGGFSFNLNNAFAYINGKRLGPTYPGALLSALATSVPRERRAQIQDRGNPVLQYDWERWFFRGTASVLYYDLMTEQLNVSGYQNYVDRYDINGGPEVGYRITPLLAATMGYRYGHQSQEQFTFSPYSSPSDYQRALLGVEGKPLKWLEFKLQGGPDFRIYAPDTASHITPVHDKHPVKYYGEAGVTALVTPKDTLAFKYKQFQWVSSIGKVPYFDSSYDLIYRRQLSRAFRLDLGARWCSADYSSGNLPTCRRDDRQYGFSAVLLYALNPHLSLSLGYSADLGRNAEDGIPNPETREYNRHLVSGGALLKF